MQSRKKYFWKKSTFNFTNPCFPNLHYKNSSSSIRMDYYYNCFFLGPRMQNMPNNTFSLVEKKIQTVSWENKFVHAHVQCACKKVFKTCVLCLQLFNRLRLLISGKNSNAMFIWKPTAIWYFWKNTISLETQPNTSLK